MIKIKKLSLIPEIIKTETKYYKLNHFVENKSKYDSTVDIGQTIMILMQQI